MQGKLIRSSLLCLVFFTTISSIYGREYGNEEIYEGPYNYNSIGSSFRGSRRLLDSGDEWKDKGISSFAKSRNSMPRYNFKFQRVSNKFNESSTDYYESIIMITIPGFLIAIVTGVTACCFCCWRCCCGFCGGKKPREGGYNTFERWIPKIFIFSFTALIIAAAIFGWVGSSGVTDNVHTLFDIAENSTKRVITISSNIEIKLNNVLDVDPTELINAIRPLKEGATEVEEQVQVAEDYFNKYNKYREIAMNISFAFAAVAVLIGVLGAVINKSFLLKIMFVAACISLVVQWVSFGIHLPITTVMADLCVAIDDYLENNANSTQNDQSVNEILRCLTDSSYNPVSDLVDDKVDDTLVSINNVTEACCNVTFDINTVRNINISSFPPLYQPVIAQYNSDIKLYFSILDDIYDLSNCSYVSDAFKQIKNVICIDMVNNLTIIIGCTAVIGIVFVGMAILAIVGWKRFPPYTGDYDDGDDDQWEEFRETSKTTSTGGLYGEESNIGLAKAHTTDGATPYHPVQYGRSEDLDLNNPPGPPPEDEEELPPYHSRGSFLNSTTYAPIDTHSPSTPRASTRIDPPTYQQTVNEEVPEEPDFFAPSAPMQTITKDQYTDEDRERFRNEQYDD